MSAPLCFLDTETTGLHPGREAWEIAMIRREADGTETTMSFFIDAGDINISGADPFGLKIGKFWERHPDFALAIRNTNGEIVNVPRHAGELSTVSAATAAWHVWNMTRGAHIVGAVPNFDTEVLDRLLRRHNYLPLWHYHLVDVENLVVGYIRGTLDAGRTVFVGQDLIKVEGAIQPPWSSRELGDILGVEQDESTLHTALGDAQWAMRMYDRVMV